MSIDFSTFINLSKEFQGQNHSKVIGLLQGVICNNQSMYIQYHFLLSEKHKMMKSEFIKENMSLDVVREYYTTMTDYAYEGISDSIGSNFKLLLEYFKLTKTTKYLPRLCVKSIHNNQVVDLYRFDPEYYTMHSVDENTSIKYIQENGLYYLCNNIPLAAKNGLYVNPRLNQAMVRKYEPSLFDRFKKDGPDKGWADCWVDNNTEHEPRRANASSCYKSTLVVPMTLLNNSLTREFQRTFFNKELKDNRTIFGFVCIDHLNANYFDEELDVKIGYIIADLMSLYFIALHIYTEKSETFNMVSELIEEKR